MNNQEIYHMRPNVRIKSSQPTELRAVTIPGQMKISSRSASIGHGHVKSGVEPQNDVTRTEYWRARAISKSDQNPNHRALPMLNTRVCAL